MRFFSLFSKMIEWAHLCVDCKVDIVATVHLRSCSTWKFSVVASQSIAQVADNSVWTTAHINYRRVIKISDSDRYDVWTTSQIVIGHKRVAWIIFSPVLSFVIGFPVFLPNFIPDQVLIHLFYLVPQWETSVSERPFCELTRLPSHTKKPKKNPFFLLFLNKF